MGEKRLQFKNRPAGFWIDSHRNGFCCWLDTMYRPAILSAVITLASNKPESAVTYMIAYVLGFAIPFLFFPFSSQNGLDQSQQLIMKTGGIIMIVVGILLFFDLLTWIIIMFSSLFGGFTGFEIVFYSRGEWFFSSIGVYYT